MWSNFFAAAASASAALAGLLFVALSVNIRRILEYSHLPARGAAAMGALILNLVCSIATLIPQGRMPLGEEILGFGCAAWLLQCWSTYRSIGGKRASHRPVYEFVVEATFGQIQTLPFIAGGILLLIGNEQALYWIASGVITVFICSMFNAWVLLVEILR